jgi:hypothetical protein
VYMEPLIDEIIELYEVGVPAVDVSAQPGSQEFTLKAALLWTIHDWPGKVFIEHLNQIYFSNFTF